MSPEAERVVRWLAKYWVQNPEAGDSAHGIADYWLRNSAYTPEQVMEGLSEMVRLGWLNEIKGLNGQRHYSSTSAQVELMRRFLSMA